MLAEWEDHTLTFQRSSHDTGIFTNDAAIFAESLSQKVSKTSALRIANAQAYLLSVVTDQARTSTNFLGTGVRLGL